MNAIVGLMATGGSTNHVIHLVAMARACGLTVTWDDMADISRVTPLLARVYPNGEADVNQFHAAGGMAFVVRELIDAGLAHEDVMTVWGPGLSAFAKEPFLEDGKLVWRDGAENRTTRRSCGPRRIRSGPMAASSCCAAISASRSSRLSRGSEVLAVTAPGARVRESGSRWPPRSRPASKATSSPWCAGRARAPMACRSCTS